MNIAILEIFSNPDCIAEMSLSDWDVVVPQARASGLLGAMGSILQAEGLLLSVPAQVRRHLESDMLSCEKQRQALCYELKWLLRVAAEIGVKLVLLKGAAYILADLPAGAGRMVSDIDILVPADRLRDVEQVVTRYGWLAAPMDPADERYYRKWMHEIPPVAHQERGSVLDIHHTILPPTSDASFDAARLFETLVEVGPGIHVLSPQDMVIHSATHLFHEGEFKRGLRDLLDLDRLIRDFVGADERFWSKLIPRARELDMLRPLYYALRYTQMFFATPVPHAVSEEMEANKPLLPGVTVMDALFQRVFTPDHSSCAMPYTALAKLCLYVRSHYLRMPLYLLLPHLARKAWKGVFTRSATAETLALGDQQA